MQLVEPNNGHLALGFQHGGADVGCFTQDRHQIVGGIFPPVVLAFLQGGEGGALIGHRGPFHAIEMYDFRAGAAIGRAVGAGDVAVEPFVDVADALQALGGDVAQRAGADEFGDGFERVGQGQAFGHHRRHEGAGFADGFGQHGESAFEAEDDGAVVGGGDFVADGQQFHAEHVARAPAFEAGDAIAGEDLGAVVPKQAVAQADAPGEAVILHHMAFGHLRLGVIVRIGAVKLVEHQAAMVAGDVGGGGVRVQEDEVDLGDEAQDACAFGRDDRRGGQGERAADEAAPSEFRHCWSLPHFCCPHFS